MFIYQTMALINKLEQCNAYGKTQAEGGKAICAGIFLWLQTTILSY